METLAWGLAESKSAQILGRIVGVPDVQESRSREIVAVSENRPVEFAPRIESLTTDVVDSSAIKEREATSCSVVLNAAGILKDLVRKSCNEFAHYIQLFM